MKKLGMMSGSKEAQQNGITTQTEKIICGGAKTNPGTRLTTKEEEYVISQLIQKNFDKRRGISVFQSKTQRSKINGFNDKKIIPPIGIYEHQFNKKVDVDNFLKRKNSAKSQDKNNSRLSNYSPNQQIHPGQVNMKHIDLPYQHKAVTQAFSCFAETQLVDFTKGQKRDDVSFYKKLARFEQAKEYGIDEKEFERLLRLEKTGKYVLNIGPS